MTAMVPLNWIPAPSSGPYRDKLQTAWRLPWFPPTPRFGRRSVYTLTQSIVTTDSQTIAAKLNGEYIRAKNNNQRLSILGSRSAYRLYVVYIPVVEKQILWSKRCKDESLRGTVKETITQVSRSKKWDSKPVLDEDGNPMLNAKGKKILKSSYSVLQDDFFNFMRNVGYTDVERGERGSTEEHLTVTQFKVQAEQQRLEAVTGQVAQAERGLEDTGTNFNRPGVQEGFALVKQGLVGCWLVKDLSRFGRDYLTVGQYTDIIFPSYDVRFIAVNDGVDSNRGDSEGFAAIRNLFNEWYPRDTSKKVRVSLRQRGTSGKHMGKPPYGYRCDPEDKDHWILDEEAAQVVKLIFDLCIDGKGPEQIARILEEKQILTTRVLYAKRKGKPLPERPYHWGNQSIVAILERQEYTGCTCNFKTYSKSYKLKSGFPTSRRICSICRIHRKRLYLRHSLTGYRN